MTSITDDVSFYTKNEGHDDIRPWINGNIGDITKPMSKLEFTLLKNKIIGKL